MDFARCPARLGEPAPLFIGDVDVAIPVADSVLLFYCSTVRNFGGPGVVSVVSVHVCGGEQARHHEPGGLYAPHPEL